MGRADDAVTSRDERSRSSNSRLAQLVEQHPYKMTVGGSNPSPGTIYTSVAHWTERLATNQQVGSSILPGGAIPYFPHSPPPVSSIKKERPSKERS